MILDLKLTSYSTVFINARYEVKKQSIAQFRIISFRLCLLNVKRDQLRSS